MSEEKVEEGVSGSIQFSFKTLSKDGFSHIVVYRDTRKEEEDGIHVVDRLFAAMQYAEKKAMELGYAPLGNGYDVVSGSVTQPHAGSRSTSQDLPATATIDGKDYINIGTGLLQDITIKMVDGKIRYEYNVSNRKLPLYDYRQDIERVLEVFDNSVWTETWTPEHMEKEGKVYTPKHFGELEVLSGKAKHWDVISIKRKD